MKAKKIIVILAGLMLLMTQISYGDAAVDRLLKEARKKQAQEQVARAVQTALLCRHRTWSKRLPHTSNRLKSWQVCF